MKQFFTIIILSILSLQMMAQESVVSPDRALELFTQGNYAEALPMYEQLIERYEREAKYNYYLGACLVEQRQNLSEAIKRLKFAQSRRVNRDVHFYLGKAYQKAYEFELAEQEFNNFLKYATNNDPRRAKALRAVEDCKSANTLINKHFSIQVIDKDTVPASAYLSPYNLPEEAGTIAKNKTFFKTGVPPEKIMYRTEKGDDVYFVLEEPDTTLHDIYFMEQLLDRWSGSKNLGEPVNSDFDDRHPFLMVDGTTFSLPPTDPEEWEVWTSTAQFLTRRVTRSRHLRIWALPLIHRMMTFCLQQTPLEKEPGLQPTGELNPELQLSLKLSGTTMFSKT